MWEKIFEEAYKKGATDIHIKPGKVPYVRINGEIQPFREFEILTLTQVENIIEGLLRRKNKIPEELDIKKSLDLAIELEGMARFRVNIYFQMGEPALAIRIIPFEIKTIEELNLPKKIEEIAMLDSGLVLVTGVAGTGKSTTLAAMLNHINHNKRVTIITIEDPIEYIIREDQSWIIQREVGNDTLSFYSGLKEALRQDPNVIMIGELRDKETIETCLMAAETGHLVLSTLHTHNASETINRIISVFPPHQHFQIRAQLSSVLKAIIAQKLIPRKGGVGRVPAVEILLQTQRVQDAIREPDKLHELSQIIEDGLITYGMQSFDQSLYYLYRKGIIDEETLLAHTSKREEMKMRIKGIKRGEEADSWAYIEKLVYSS